MLKKLSTTETLAKNLRYLMDLEGLSEAKTAKRTGVSQRAINKILNGQSSPTVDTAEKLANGFGLNLWHIIMPNLPEDLKTSPSISRLYENFISASLEGRDYISHVAEREASYKKNNS